MLGRGPNPTESGQVTLGRMELFGYARAKHTHSDPLSRAILINQNLIDPKRMFISTKSSRIIK